MLLAHHSPPHRVRPRRASILMGLAFALLAPGSGMAGTPASSGRADSDSAHPLAEELAQGLHGGVFRLPDDAMAPALKRHDLAVYSAPESGEALQVGDVVLFRTGAHGVWVCHRIVGQEPDGRFITRGDDNPTEDLFHPTAREMRGRVHFVVNGQTGAVSPVSRVRGLRAPGNLPRWVRQSSPGSSLLAPFA